VLVALWVSRFANVELLARAVEAKCLFATRNLANETLNAVDARHATTAAIVANVQCALVAIVAVAIRITVWWHAAGQRDVESRSAMMTEAFALNARVAIRHLANGVHRCRNHATALVDALVQCTVVEVVAIGVRLALGFRRWRRCGCECVANARTRTAAEADAVVLRALRCCGGERTEAATFNTRFEETRIAAVAESVIVSRLTRALVAHVAAELLLWKFDNRRRRLVPMLFSVASRRRGGVDGDFDFVVSFARFRVLVRVLEYMRAIRVGRTV